LAKKASSKAAREAAKINKLALQAVAAEKRGVEKDRRKKERRKKERRKKEKEEKVQKLAQKKREREQKPSLLNHPQRRGNRYLNQDQTGPQRSRQSDNQVAVHQVWKGWVSTRNQNQVPHPKPA
jgi:hypothetical protein